MDITNASIAKILLEYSEYNRLKHIENKYLELQREKNKQKSSQSGAGYQVPINVATTSSNQIGAGGIASTSTNFISESPIQSSENPLFPEEVISEPNPTTSTVIPYDVTIRKNNESSVFDDNHLLALIPKSSLSQAKKLLNDISLRSSELTWNSVGTIFIDETAIPNSNIFLAFPFLFKKSKAKSGFGFQELEQKLNEMGLLELTKHQIAIKKTKKEFGTASLTSTKNVPWWYIGP